MFNLTKQHKPQLCKQTSKSNPFFPLPANSRVVRTTLGLSIDEAGPYVCVDTTECGINNGIYGIRGCPLRATPICTTVVQIKRARLENASRTTHPETLF